MSLILTLRLDAESQSRFDELRNQHFPPELNHIAAHLTLFHKLPEHVQTETTVAAAAERRGVFSLEIAGLRSLGRGVAYQIRSPTLKTLHAELAEAFAAELIPQDRQRFDAHVVIQNKVDPSEARSLRRRLEAEFQPGRAWAVGLDLWRYLGGPWQHARTVLFQQGGLQGTDRNPGA